MCAACLLAVLPVDAGSLQAGETASAPRKLTGLVFARTSQRELKLDLQFPDTASGKPWPVLVWIHGGGWMEGHRGFSPLWPLTAEGYAVASISYRFAKDAVFPAQIQDVKSAIRWLRAHAAEYHLDPERIGVAGESAGGHLAALLGVSSEVKKWETGENLDQSSGVQCVVALCPPTDFTRDDPSEPSAAELMASGNKAKMQGAAQILSREVTVSRLLGAPVRKDLDKARAASPITYVSSSSPPFLLVHGDKDYLVPLFQSVIFRDALLREKVPVELRIIKGAGHGFGRFRPDLLAAVKTFFDATLKQADGTESVAGPATASGKRP